MPDNILKGIIQVTAPGVENTFKVVGLAALSTERSFNTLQSRVASFGGGVRTFTTAFRTSAPEISRTNQALQNYTRSTNTATAASINLGRIIQDAPFGFIGIANNLNPLIESFQRLKAETGSTGSAFKALAGSIFGAGGLGLAVSLLSFGLTKLGMANRGAKEESEVHKKEVDAAAEKQREFKEAVDAASQSIINQSGKLSDLKSILISTSTEVKNITQATVQQALAAFLFDKKNVAVQQLLSAELEKQLNLRKQQKPFAETPEFQPDLFSKNKFDKQIAEAKEGVRSVNDLSFGLDGLFSNLFNQKFKTDKAKESTDDFVKYTIARGKQLADEFQDIAIVPKFTIFDTIKEQFEKAKGFINQFETGAIQFKPNISFDRISETMIKGSPLDEKAWQEYLNTRTFRLVPRVDIEPPPSEKEPELLTKSLSETQRIAGVLGDEFSEYFNPDYKIDSSLVAAVERAKSPAAIAAANLGKDTAQAFNAAIQNISVDGISSFAEGIGEALGGEDILSAFQGFAMAIGSGLQAMGKQIIAIGAAALLAKESLKTLFANPGVAIAAGVALVAAGAAMKSVISKGIPGRASGGPVKKGQSYIVGEIGQELFVPNEDGTIIPNRSLNKSFGNSPIKSFFDSFNIMPNSSRMPGNGMPSLGNFGGMNLSISGTFRQQGKDLVAVIAQMNQSGGRLNP